MGEKKYKNERGWEREGEREEENARGERERSEMGVGVWKGRRSVGGRIGGYGMRMTEK